jgi:rhodanese-related sulfurtransferase
MGPGERASRLARRWGCTAVALLVVTSAAWSAPVAAPAPAGKDTSAVERVSIAQAMLAVKRGEIVLVDVRLAGQRALGHVTGDVHIPLSQLAARAGELPNAKKWVFYCSCVAEETALEAARVVLRSGPQRVAVLVGGYDAWRSAGGAVQVDAGWEQVFRVDTPPSGWGKTPVDSARCRYTRDATNAYRGGASACITCVPAAEVRGFAGFSQKLDARPLRGLPLTFSAIVKTENLEQHAFVWIAVEDAQGRTLPLSPPDGAPITGTSDWHPVQAAGVVPRDAVHVLVGISLVTSGRVWVDDVRLVADAPGRPGMRAVLENHGFEED